MAGGYSSPWTTLGSNSNETRDTGTDSGGKFGTEPNVEIIKSTTGASGIDAQVRHECTMWNVDAADFSTLPFDWAVISDFTVIVNGAGQSMAVDPGAVEVMVEGSLDGNNYYDVLDLGDWSPGTSAVIQHFVYDYDANGRHPYMRLTLNSANATDNSDEPFKVNVIPHTI